MSTSFVCHSNILYARKAKPSPLIEEAAGGQAYTFEGEPGYVKIES
jgi:hypothetical protein